ncbi:hypothetical protein NKR23_g7155 [Pleurostoma richardsiae]|uniref:N-acetyltransferase domain-containing protein n=1 Tax=Pleurostoma richardsiae TaxID=41990 RepID=A0AA38RAT4_9PEZI|nr:hypothetical protein NKR23_g7155 [Pleurostoma richardsiae]
MEKAFTSARLVCRALEHDSLEDDELIVAILKDALGYANSNSSMLKPQSKQSTSRVAGKQATPIGVVSLGKTSPNNAHHRDADISVDIVPGQQRRGYGSEAIEWVLNWGFQIAGLHRIGIESFSYNEGAGRLYERLGFELAGRREEFIWFNGQWHGMLCFVMLEDQWREREALKAAGSRGMGHTHSSRLVLLQLRRQGAIRLPAPGSSAEKIEQRQTDTESKFWPGVVHS